MGDWLCDKIVEFMIILPSVLSLSLCTGELECKELCGTEEYNIVVYVNCSAHQKRSGVDFPNEWSTRENNLPEIDDSVAIFRDPCLVTLVPPVDWTCFCLYLKISVQYLFYIHFIGWSISFSLDSQA